MPKHNLFLTLLPLLPQASAWGTLGHETVAFIAQNFVTSATKTWAEGILDNTSSTYLAGVATWADTYRYTSEGAFSADYHFIDANDNPPSSCNVDYDRDCGDSGCVVSAIANYTSRVTDSKVSAAEKTKALKWIVHFVGDIHQPLHDEALDVGGNSIDVTFEGDSTNLHHIWDTNMPEKLIGGYSISDAKTWATNLTTEIKSGSYKSKAAGWLTGISISDAKSSAMTWATDSNAYVCSTVLPSGVSAVSGKELDGSYYTTSIPVIELQIAKAGYRLAAWLDLIATGKTGLKIRELSEVEKREALSLDAFKVVPRDEEKIQRARMARAAFGGCRHEH